MSCWPAAAISARCISYYNCVEYCMHDFTNFNDLCLTRNTSCRPKFLMKKKLNLFSYNIDFCSVQNMKKFLGIAYI